ncbi:MAG: DUF3179 domain-containing protein [Pyrinomonadaceae bacterium]|nr:DUF3179 domain-containing protein [Pyrinomonadaceae bacterium]
MNGQTLNFELAGINNQNFIMRDTQTGSWWQQISGEAIQGSFKGQKLVPVNFDEISFGIWKRENPNGRVLRPDNNKTESADWENQVGKMPVRINAKIEDTFEPRAIMIGIKIGETAKAYPFSALEKQSPIIDTVGGTNIVLLLADDKKSVRAFERTLEGRKLEFLRKTDTNELVDAETGSVWDFSGKAIKGELEGKQLIPVQIIKDYWFDWKTYNPNTLVYRLENR